MIVDDEYGLPASDAVTSGTVADCSKALLYYGGIEAEAFFSDKAHDANELFDTIKEAHISAIIPPVKSRKE